ncbi:Deproteinrin del-1, partial [Parelaphostrongylus tenuis]
MSMIYSAAESSPTRKLLSADDDETNIESVPYREHFPYHSQSYQSSSIPSQKQVYVVDNESSDSSSHDITVIKYDPYPYLLKPVHPSERRPSHLRRIRAKIIQCSKEFGSSMKLSNFRNSPLKHAIVKFIETTTAHGIPMILNTSRLSVRILWIIFSTVSLICFCIQCMLVFEKYQKKEKIVNVELEFESAPFPAITVCNLNPFKNHLARSVQEISETLDAFHQAVTYSNTANHERIRERKKRNAITGKYRFVQYEAVYSACDCGRGVTVECVGSDAVPPNITSACICNYDRRDGSAWPCYSTKTWMEQICPECNDIGYCNMPNTTGTDSIPCLCQMNMGYCILKGEERLRRVWEFRGRVVPPVDNPFRSDFLNHLRELGYGNMTDQVAITTRAKQELILKMSVLPPQRRAALGYGKSELIKQCSFNSMQCDIEKEFKLHIDPEFGNCYTFNADPSRVLASSRAGPSYGLRLLMFVNTSDYLPTTEATGVRITIHGQEECPFPDTFGYSAPTGAVSAFGISLKKVNRLKDGGCFDRNTSLPLGYIYRSYSYEPEIRCYRNCYQIRIINRCGCADPRFPKPSSRTEICDIRNEYT